MATCFSSKATRVLGVQHAACPIDDLIQNERDPICSRTILVKVHTTLARDIGLGAMSRAVTSQWLVQGRSTDSKGAI